MAQRKKKQRPDWRSESNIKWCQDHIVIPEGKNIGKPLVLADFMVKDFEAIYDNPALTRRAIITRGRKNGKTFEAAIIVLNHLCGPEAIPNSQIYSAAQSRDQAAVLFALAAKMVRLNTYLNSKVTIRETKKELYCAEDGTVYRALSAEATTAFGLSPALIIHDELGQSGRRNPKKCPEILGFFAGHVAGLLRGIWCGKTVRNPHGIGLSWA